MKRLTQYVCLLEKPSWAYDVTYDVACGTILTLFVVTFANKIWLLGGRLEMSKAMWKNPVEVEVERDSN